jgi:hypothetical protein
VALTVGGSHALSRHQCERTRLRASSVYGCGMQAVGFCSHVHEHHGSPRCLGKRRDAHEQRADAAPPWMSLHGGCLCAGTVEDGALWFPIGSAGRVATHKHTGLAERATRWSPLNTDGAVCERGGSSPTGSNDLCRGGAAVASLRQGDSATTKLAGQPFQSPSPPLAAHHSGSPVHPPPPAACPHRVLREIAPSRRDKCMPPGLPTSGGKQLYQISK